MAKTTTSDTLMMIYYVFFHRLENYRIITWEAAYRKIIQIYCKGCRTSCTEK